MPPEKRTKEYRCERCGKVFTSLMRLQHHRAAEHAIKTSHDITRTGDILRRNPPIQALGSHRPLPSLRLISQIMGQ